MNTQRAHEWICSGACGTWICHQPVRAGADHRRGGEFVDAQDRSIEEALELCRDADGILVRRLSIASECIRRLRRCRVIVRYGVGTDNIDVQAATEAGSLSATCRITASMRSPPMPSRCCWTAFAM